MQDSREDRIRRRAHAIWEREGHPDGRHEVHWAQARSEVEAEERMAEAEVETVALVAGPEPPRRRRSRAPKEKAAGDAPAAAAASGKPSKAIWSPADIKPEKAASASRTRRAAKHIA